MTLDVLPLAARTPTTYQCAKVVSVPVPVVIEVDEGLARGGQELPGLVQHVTVEGMA